MPTPITHTALCDLGFILDDDKQAFAFTLRTVTVKARECDDEWGRQFVVCLDGACWLTEYDRHGEVQDLVGLPDCRDLERVELLLKLLSDYPDPQTQD